MRVGIKQNTINVALAESINEKLKTADQDVEIKLGMDKAIEYIKGLFADIQKIVPLTANITFTDNTILTAIQSTISMIDAIANSLNSESPETQKYDVEDLIHTRNVFKNNIETLIAEHGLDDEDTPIRDKRNIESINHLLARLDNLIQSLKKEEGNHDQLPPDSNAQPTTSDSNVQPTPTPKDGDIPAAPPIPYEFQRQQSTPDNMSGQEAT